MSPILNYMNKIEYNDYTPLLACLSPIDFDMVLLYNLTELQYCCGRHI